MQNSDKEKRTIETVLDRETGAYIEAIEFFKNPKENESKIFEIRRQLEDAIQGIRQPLYVCWYCKQLIKIRAESKKILHFAHLKDSDDCRIKTGRHLSEEEIRRIKYNGCQESERHFTLKHFIAENLRKNLDVSNVKVEPIRKLSIDPDSKEWRRPDVAIDYREKKLVFELQLSTTFLSVIVEREHFYKRDKTFIVWIFDQFEEDKDLQSFTFKDIHYSCKRNAFILNGNASEKTIENNDLTLLCYYERPKIENGKIIYTWEKEYVSLANLNFDEENYKVYFYDTEKETEKLKQWLQEEHERIERERKEQLESRIQILRLLLRDLFKTDILSTDLLRGIENLTSEEQARFRQFLLNEVCKDYGNPPKPLVYTLYTGKHKTLLAFLKQYLQQDFVLEAIFNNVIRSRLNGQELHRDIEKFLLAIFSLNVNEVVGSKLPNILALSNNILQSKPEFGNLFIKASKTYRRFGELNRADSFRKKVKTIEIQKPQQNHDYDDVLKKVFPELF